MEEKMEAKIIIKRSDDIEHALKIFRSIFETLADHEAIIISTQQNLKISNTADSERETLRAALISAFPPDMTYIEVAKRLGTSPGHLSRLMCGMFNPTRAMVKRITIAFNPSADVVQKLNAFVKR